MNISRELFKLKDPKYQKFQSALMPTVDSNMIIGVRTPALKKLSKEIFKENKYDSFLNTLPHKYYEENNIHAFLIGQIKDYDSCIKELNRFLPYVNNWATCDSMYCVSFKRNKDKLIKDIKKWLKSKETYTVRFGIGMLMGLYLDEDFKPEHLKLVSKVKSDEYYVNMMKAWYFATALAKQYDETLPYFENKVLDDFTHRKAISKCIDSYRIDEKTKEYLKTLR